MSISRCLYLWNILFFKMNRAELCKTFVTECICVEGNIRHVLEKMFTFINVASIGAKFELQVTWLNFLFYIIQMYMYIEGHSSTQQLCAFLYMWMLSLKMFIFAYIDLDLKTAHNIYTIIIDWEFGQYLVWMSNTYHKYVAWISIKPLFWYTFINLEPIPIIYIY